MTPLTRKSSVKINAVWYYLFIFTALPAGISERCAEIVDSNYRIVCHCDKVSTRCRRLVAVITRIPWQRDAHAINCHIWCGKSNCERQTVFVVAENLNRPTWLIFATWDLLSVGDERYSHLTAKKWAARKWMLQWKTPGCSFYFASGGVWSIVISMSVCLSVCLVLAYLKNHVIFSHNGANGPESKTMRMFRPVGQLSAPGAKSAISDCILFITLVVIVIIQQTLAVPYNMWLTWL